MCKSTDGGCVAMVAGWGFFWPGKEPMRNSYWLSSRNLFLLGLLDTLTKCGASCILPWWNVDFLYTAQLLKFLNFNNISYPVSLLSLFLELAWKAPSPIEKIYYISEGPFKMCVNLKVSRERRANSQRELLYVITTEFSAVVSQRLM